MSQNEQGGLKVAVIGLGYFSQFHLDSWNRMEGAELVAVCDQTPELADEVGEKFGCRGFDNLAGLLEETEPDIVDLVLPPQAQAEAIRQAAVSGRLLICQKPFAGNLAKAKQLTELADSRNCDLIIHENFRFQPWYRTIKALIDANELGDIVQARFSLRPGDGRGEEAYLARQPSFQKMEKFLIHETGVHFIDLHAWLFGNIESVYADLRQLNQSIAGEDAGMVLFNHSTGARSVFDGNRLLDHAADDRRKTMGEMTIEGSKATIRLDGNGTVEIRNFGSSEWKAVELIQEIDPDSFGGGCVHALNQHAVSNYTTKQFENTAQQYLRIIEIEEAIYRSNDEIRLIDIA